MSLTNVAIAKNVTTTITSQKQGYYINKNFDVVPNDKKANKKVILLTIDDGPSKYSKVIVATLLKHKAPAIFFINGMHNKKNLGTIAFEANSGFAIGNHTWSHANLKKIKNDSIVREIDSNTKLILELTGKEPAFFRPPYGAINKFTRDLVKKNNMIFMNWSGAVLDWEKSAKDEKVFLSNVMNNLHSGEILLLHEHEWTAKYLDTLLTTLEQKGYTFVDPKDILK